MSSVSTNSKWADLAPRLGSAVAMALIAGAAIWAGGLPFILLISIVIGLCVWEFARLVQPSPNHVPVVLGVVAAISLLFSWGTEGMAPGIMLSPKITVLFLVPLLGVILISGHRLLVFSYALLIMLAGLGFVAIGPGLALMWFILIVIVSDVAGYFAGRVIGGPKFWPRVSPKKTWSGTIAGWIGAMLLGLVAVQMGMFEMRYVLLMPFVAFAGQMGDIVESAIKRKFDVKDSSNIIPGHGGVLDRFDAMIGASGAIVILFAIATLLFAG